MSALTDKLRRPLVLGLAAGALAIGVPAAAIASGGGDDTSSTSSNAPAFIQDETTPEQQPRGDREDCPEKDGAAPESGSSSSSTEL